VPSLEQQTLPDGHHVVRATGDLDRTDLTDLRRAIRLAFEQAIDGVVLDMSEVSYIDSSVLATLIAESLDADKRDAILVIVTGTGGIMRSLELKGLIEIMHVATTLDDAMKLLPSV
jgi:anti-anti-sigma factor